MVYISLFNVTHSKFDSVKNALSKYYNSFGVLPTMVRVKLNKKTSSVGENNQSWQWFYSVSVIDSLRVKSTPIRARYLPVLKKKYCEKPLPSTSPVKPLENVDSGTGIFLTSKYLGKCF